MSITRTLTAVALAATAALTTTTTLAVAPARAGGAPDLGTVTVDRQARLGAAGVTVRGTYTCTVPDSGVTTGPGTLGVELVTREGVASAGSVAVTCDGITRTWTVTAPAGSLRPGRVAVSGHVEVCDTVGNCPWDLFESSVQVVRRR